MYLCQVRSIHQDDMNIMHSSQALETLRPARDQPRHPCL